MPYRIIESALKSLLIHAARRWPDSFRNKVRLPDTVVEEIDLKVDHGTCEIFTGKGAPL